MNLPTSRPPAPGSLRVAAVLIARNEAPRIARALASVAPWVDECVVLDTGSTDATVDRARQAGARIGHFTWVDDFAAARNAALDLAGADWHVVLDADEWLAEGGPTLAALRHTPPRFVGALRVDSQQDAAGSGAGVAPSWLSRVLPGPVRYLGRIHEQPQHGLPVQRLPVVLGHSGYLEGRRPAKDRRNTQLLRAALAQQPHDAYLWYQMGKNHDVNQRYADALPAFDRAEQLLRQAPAWLHDLCVRRLHALKQTGQYARALQLAERDLARWSESPDFFFALGDVLLDWASREPAHAPRLLPLIEDAWQRCLLLGERPDLEGAVAGRGSHLAAHNLALLYDLLERPDEAQRCRVLAAAHPPA